jgi:hypothetical protein
MKNSAWFLAITHPISILMFVVAAAAGLLFDWWLFPAGLVYWGVMVLVLVFESSRRDKHSL